MCGISAIYSFTKLTDSDNEKLSLMNKEMHYRGPDESGVWSDEICGLAQTRLSIIGLDNGHQPIFNENNDLVLICNGEIYNYVELREDLINKGHVFSTESDCETILHLYEEYNVNCLSYLRGMFAFCLWDKKKEQLFAARDRVGEKTLYYSQLPTGIVFSTELKAIQKYFIETPQLNLKSLTEAIRYNYPINLKETFIEQIKRLKAGEYAVVNSSGIELKTYWKRNLNATFKGSYEDAKLEALGLMRESVDLCLRSDVPVAVLLSGGIDSSLIAALAKQTGREVHAITAGYKGSPDCDERTIAKQFAEEQGLIYHEVELDVNDFKDLFKECSSYIDEPVCDVASMSQFALYKKAKELGFTVLLGGLGGDEIFYGYPYYNILANSLTLTKEHRSFFPWNSKRKKLNFLKFFSKYWKHVLFAGYPMILNDSVPVHWTFDDFNKFKENTTIEVNSQIHTFSDIDVSYHFSNDARIKDVYDYMFTRFMNAQCLYLADRLGMGTSVELRSPLVDYKLVEFVSSLPEEMKYKHGNPKCFLKDVLKDIIPDYILSASKKGFTPPFDYIYQMNNDYKYQLFNGKYVFFNSMLADTILSKVFKR